MNKNNKNNKNYDINNLDPNKKITITIIHVIISQEIRLCRKRGILVGIREILVEMIGGIWGIIVM